MNITEEQIKKIASQEIDIKDLFPEVFNFTGWAKDKRKIFENWLGYFENNILEYGINNSGAWFNIDNGTQYNPNIERPATHEEIKNALVKEAKRRGYEFDFYDLIHNRLWVSTKEKGSWYVFDNGNWKEVKKEPKYVLVSEGLYLKDFHLRLMYIYLNKDKDFAIIFETKEKAEAMNVLLYNKYKLEEI